MAFSLVASRTCRFVCKQNRKMLSKNWHNTEALLCSDATNFSRPGTKQSSSDAHLLRHIKAKIALKGPITVAEYMKEVLTNPSAGYYMHRDVFGAEGDFITSPEISQMFGELIGIWCVNEWLRCGSPSKINIVELGPGRGTLADDILRVCSKFDGIREAVSLHLVEVSPELTRIQRQRLVGNIDVDDHDSFTRSKSKDNNKQSPPSAELKENRLGCSDEAISEKTISGRSPHGPSVSWHKQLSDVPTGFSFYVAHEFFDALPIHKFQRNANKWHEVLIDVDPTSDDRLRYVLSSRDTAASSLLLKYVICAKIIEGDRKKKKKRVLVNVARGEERDHIELCPDAALIVGQIARRISDDGGYSLIADYGHNLDKTDTFRAFRNHKLFDPLREPGSADLTADVDFNYLNNIVKDTVMTHGPVTQQHFLFNMGIQVRLQVLLSRATSSEQKSLMSGFDMLTNPDKMGQRFKFFSMLRRDTEKTYIPAGF